jgi:hypothetical protein
MTAGLRFPSPFRAISKTSGAISESLARGLVTIAAVGRSFIGPLNMEAELIQMLKNNTRFNVI